MKRISYDLLCLLTRDRMGRRPSRRQRTQRKRRPGWKAACRRRELPSSKISGLTVRIKGGEHLESNGEHLFVNFTVILGDETRVTGGRAVWDPRRQRYALVPKFAADLQRAVYKRSARSGDADKVVTAVEKLLTEHFGPK